MALDDVLLHVFIFTANALSMILFWWFKKIEKEVEVITKEMHNMRTNYRDRFDEIKDLINKGNLDLVERLIRLEAQHYTIKHIPNRERDNNE